MKNYFTLKLNSADRELEKTIKTINNELNIFFNFKIKEPLLFLVDYRKDLDLIWGKKTENWFVGAFKQGNIYVLNPKVFEKESSHQKEEFEQILKHEYCHVYFTQITKGHSPSWLNEGLACFLSGKKLVLKNDYENKLLNIFSYYNEVDSDVYMVGQYWVEFLLKKFGKKKFLKLISSLDLISNERQFSIKFYEIYGFKFSKTSFLKLV